MARSYDVIILGAGAAGMMAAGVAGQRGRRVLVLDHARAAGEKIRISGGGRCNFTNRGTVPAAFLSENPRYCVSALSRYKPADFIALVDRYKIAWHEKKLGQLFCDHSAGDIINLLKAEMELGGVELKLETTISAVSQPDGSFHVETDAGAFAAPALVVATGGKSIPKMGATGFGLQLAEQFGLRVTETRPALVPLTFDAARLEAYSDLAGVAVDGRVELGKTRFDEAVLFTHRGLSGPAILQISSYWREGQAITLSLAPRTDILAAMKAARKDNGRQSPATVLGQLIPKRLAQKLGADLGLGGNLADCSDKLLSTIADAVNGWEVKPVGSEGYRTAEVMLGGVDTRDLNSQTMAARNVPGLYFIGEVVDVTGWLGGYNFQWAWASGWVAGQSV